MGGGNILQQATSKSIEIYDTITKTWTLQIETMPEELCEHSLFVVGTDIYLFGGTTITGQPRVPISKFNTRLKTWKTIYLTPGILETNMKNVTLVDGTFYIFYEHGTVVAFNPRNDKASIVDVVDTLPVSIEKHAFSMDGSIYMICCFGEELGQLMSMGTIVGETITWRIVDESFFTSRWSFGLVTSIAIDQEEDVLDGAIARLQNLDVGNI
jgi:hypothetical protein